MNTSNQYSPEARERAVRMMRESLESGQSASVVARRNGINPNHLFHWRKLYRTATKALLDSGRQLRARHTKTFTGRPPATRVSA
ncbi:transposase [Azotobacter chroococcum]|uniref:transposase n=1 Tax=Azotobacter chroococcum TaxID=353 RepID=UPI002696B5FF